MKARIIVTAISLLAGCMLMHAASATSEAPAPKYAIEITAGKKIIHVSELDIPATTSLSVILKMFPELLVNRGNDILQNYDLKVNSVQAGNAKNAFLQNILAGDILKIELEDSPQSTTQKNSQTGVIKVTLKDLKEGWSGNAMLLVSSAFDIIPVAKVNYRKENLELRGAVMFRQYRPTMDVSRKESVYGHSTQYQLDSTRINNGYQLVNLDLKYTPSKVHKLHCWFMESSAIESTDKKSNTQVNSVNSLGSRKENNKAFPLQVGANYCITPGNRFKAEIEATFQGDPTDYSNNKYLSGKVREINTWSYSATNSSRSLNGKIEATYKIIAEQRGKRINVSCGLNARNTPTDFSYKFNRIPTNGLSELPSSESLSSHSSTTYLSPYLTSDNIFGNWYLKGQIRYQHYNTVIRVEDKKDYTKKSDLLTAYINAGYQIAPHHHISTIIKRDIQYMNEDQIYPYMTFSPMNDKFLIGNPDLRPSPIHSASLDYITDWTTDSGHFFNINAGIKYVNMSRIIDKSYYKEYYTYLNNGASNVGIMNVLFLYKYNRLSLSLTGNYFINNSVISDKDVLCTYYNLSFQPTISIGDGWCINGQFTYNSKVITQDSSLSSYFYASSRILKHWDRWTGYIELNDCLHSTAHDRFYGKAIKETLEYNLNRPTVGIGCIFSF